ncbi:MAG: hypothetical protein ACREYE_24340 [Gammaproteobacteria bacterium]
MYKARSNWYWYLGSGETSTAHVHPSMASAVALANKLARIAWAVLARDRRYRADWAEQSV